MDTGLVAVPIVSPLVVLASVTIFRWIRFTTKHGQPRIQWHLSDLLLGTLWIALAGLASTLCKVLGPGWQYFAGVLAVTTIAGVASGKIWSLTSPNTDRLPAPFYLSIGSLTGMLTAFGSGAIYLVYLMTTIRC